MIRHCLVRVSDTGPVRRGHAAARRIDNGEKAACAAFSVQWLEAGD
jgi:hypothetical protein